MARDMFKFVNTVGWKNDLESFRRLKKEVRGFKKEMDNLYKGVNKNMPRLPTGSGTGNAPRKPRPTAPPTNNDEKFAAQRDDMIRNFMISNRQLRELNAEEKKILQTELKRLTTVKELRYRMREIKTTLSDNLAASRKFTREQEKQNALAKRANASYMQLGTSIASIYTALAAGQSIVRTGMAFEGIEKTLLAVTGNASDAKEEFKFLREESMRLGISISQGGKAYAKLLAAGKGKLALQDIRDTFTAVSEAGVVLGLSQDDQAGSIRALQQMMAKGQVMSEELKGQLGERLPTASIAMAQAAQDIGLIGKDIKKANLEEHLFKLMENGKVLAKDILPAFSKRLKESANAGNAVAIALRENFAVALGIATNNVESLSDSLFVGGLGGSLKLVLDSFNEISPKIQDAAYLFGKVLGGAITGVTFPVVMLVAGLTDLWTITKMVTGVNDEMGASFLSLGAQIIGVLAGVKLLIWGLKKVASLAGVIKGAKDLVKGGGTDIGKGGKSPKSPSKFGKIGGGLSKVGGLAFNPYVLAGTAGISAAMEHGGSGGALSAGSIFGKNSFTNFLDTPISELFSSKGNASTANSTNNPYTNPKLELNIKTTVDESGNLQSYVDGRIESVDIENQERAMNSIGSLY